MNATARSNGKHTQTREAASDFERLLSGYYESSAPERVRTLKEHLLSRIDHLESLLPPFLKGQAERLIQRAILLIGDKAELQDASPASVIKCVLQAAELGFALDGRMVHAVVYNNKKKMPGGGEKWVKEAQLNVDYKGLIAFAKRQNLIRDAYARLVMPTDDFAMSEQDGRTHYNWSPDIEASRGNKEQAVGVFAVAHHPDGWFRLDYMPMVDVLAVRDRSKAAKGFSPWKTDFGEMAKKTVLRRILKTFTDDPGMAYLFQVDRDFDDEPEAEAPPKASVRNRISSRLRHGDSEPASEPPEPQGESVDDETTEESEPKAKKPPKKEPEPETVNPIGVYKRDLKSCTTLDEVNLCCKRHSSMIEDESVREEMYRMADAKCDDIRAGA